MASATTVLGDRWSLLILRSALYGVSRFDDLQRELDIGRSVLSGRLARLVDAQLLTKSEYREEGDRLRPEYTPTAAARELALVFAAMQEWGDRWIRRKPALIRPRKRGTREPLRVAFVEKGVKTVALDDVTMG